MRGAFFREWIKDRQIDFEAEKYELEHQRDDPCRSCRFYDPYAGCIYPDEGCAKEKGE